ncbi:hypothetical protein OV079_32990 [Nannocystis pusilla]|uniref:Uncharacterized protein n=1 Tax=Nannocystis pusilla TaxID=889268 RepID=A0A9X3J077_9BACT|nr:hypothetical protein [Nannocystis pusilla]MCY1010301.1 hypothetical protein [Nannocystis pusilla]
MTRRRVDGVGEQAAGALDVLALLPRDLTAEDREQRRVGLVGDDLQTARGQLDEALGVAGALGGLLEHVERAEVPVGVVLVLEHADADRVGVLERLAEEVRRHVGVVEAHLPDQRELTQQRDLLVRLALERGAAVLQLLDVLQVTAAGEQGLGDVAGLVVARIGVEGLEQQRQQARVFGRLLLQDPRGAEVERRQLVATVLDVRGQRVSLAAERDQLVDADVLQRELPVAPVVERLLEAVLELLIATLGAGRRLEVRARLLDLSQVEQRPPVGVVQGRGPVGVTIGPQLERHQLGDHLEVGHLLIDLARRLQGLEVLTVALDGRLVERHRLGLVEQQSLAGLGEVVERRGLRLRRAGGARLRLGFVDHPAPLGDLGEP